jgi:hypothetical protein
MDFDLDQVPDEHKSLAAEVLLTIAKLVSPGAVAVAEVALHAVQLILDEFQRAVKGEITGDSVKSELRRHLQALKDIDDKYDAALAAKFPKKD